MHALPVTAQVQDLVDDTLGGRLVETLDFVFETLPLRAGFFTRNVRLVRSVDEAEIRGRLHA